MSLRSIGGEATTIPVLGEFGMLYSLSREFLFIVSYLIIYCGYCRSRLRVSKPLLAVFILASLAAAFAMNSTLSEGTFYHNFHTITSFFFVILFALPGAKPTAGLCFLTYFLLAVLEDFFAILSILFGGTDFPEKDILEIRLLEYDLLLVLCLSVVFMFQRKCGPKFRGQGRLERAVFRHKNLWATFAMADLIFILLYTLTQTQRFQRSNLRLVCVMLISCAVVFVFNSMLLMLAVASRDRLEKTNKILNACHVMLQEFYQALLEQELETKKYRHDMKNHFLCMESLARHNKFQDLEEYIQRISKNISEAKIIYRTGNDIIDAILYRYSEEGRKEGITFSVAGAVTLERPIQEDDLCVLFSNLITNAYEAAFRAEGEQNKRICVAVAQGKRYLELSVENYHKGREVTLDTPTTKSDPGNHGFGLKSIGRIVARYEGNITFTREGDWLKVRVIIKMI